MNTDTDHSSFLLVDGAQLALAEIVVPSPDNAPEWLIHIYESEAALVSPLLIDIFAAHCVGASDEITALFSALRPQLHASLIDTNLSHKALAHHLRRFIMIRTEEGKAFTLRFADCTVLQTLSAVLARAQWAAMVGPIARWCVHDLDDGLRELPPPEMILVPAPPPLVLSDEQITMLYEATAPSMMLAHLLEIAQGEALPGTPSEQHRWASEARYFWRSAGSCDDIVLRWLTSAALETRRQVLQKTGLPTLLKEAELPAIRESLQAAVGDHHARQRREIGGKPA